MNKVEYKKDYKELYLPGANPAAITVPKMQFFMLDGKGDPNQAGFDLEIQALYSLSYGIRMLPKSGSTPPGYVEYTVFPLEGVWDLAEAARNLKEWDKSQLVYTIMIRQPDFVTEELAREVLEKTKEKKPNQALSRVRFGAVEEGLCVQMMHTGNYDDEPASFARMDEFCRQNGYRRLELTHREIYISDPRKVAPDKRKTVLRYQVERV